LDSFQEFRHFGECSLHILASVLTSAHYMPLPWQANQESRIVSTDRSLKALSAAESNGDGWIGGQKRSREQKRRANHTQTSGRNNLDHDPLSPRSYL